VRGPSCNVNRLARYGRAAFGLGVAGASICFALRGLGSAALLPSFVAMMFGGFVGGALASQGSNSAFARVLRSSILTGIGKISFAIYLFNLPIYTVMHGHFAGRMLAFMGPVSAELTRVFVGNGLLLLAALVSWRWFEAPILRMKSRWAGR